jgi:hypothetical protein
MAEIIPFHPKPRAARAVGAQQAHILFFTGVRYVRMSDEDFARAAKARRATSAKTAAPRKPRKKKIG